MDRERPGRPSGNMRTIMPTEDKAAFAAQTTIDLEAVAALDAALYWAGAVSTRYSLPIESLRVAEWSARQADRGPERGIRKWQA
jgi:hypothetical protein